MAETKKKDWVRTKAYREMRDQLIADLKTSGLENAYFLDLVNRYMQLWCCAKELEEDISIRGIRVEYQNGTQRGETDNKSLDRLMKVYGMMNKFHQQFGYHEMASQSRKGAFFSDTDDEDDEL